MAGEPIPACALSPAGGHVAAADSAARRVDRKSHAVAEPLQSKRFRVGRGMAIGDASTRRPLSNARDFWRAAKTVLSKMLKALVDPNAAPLRALPREERELMIAANNGYLLAFDNLSVLPAWLSDALCRLASGGSFAVRQLYTDDDEVLFQAARPMLVNGIEDVITRPDLADRAIFLTLPPVADARRQSERELWRQFELARPRILGALLNLVVHGLRALPRIGLDRLPRMADFALWAAACETTLWRAGTFHRAYEANRRAAIEGIIDADPVAACVREIVAECSSWTGSAADLLRAGAGRSSTNWPTNPRALAGRLRRAQTFLRALGIDITFSREGRSGSRIIRIRATQESTVSTVSTVSSVCDQRPPRPAGEVCDDIYSVDLVGRCRIGQVPAAADDADGPDANAAFCFD
jgi:hypothetical protein